MRLYAENLGDGTSTQPVAFLRSLNGSQIQLKDARTSSAPPLAPGQRGVYDFSFSAANELKGDPLSFELHIYDKLHGRAVMEKVSIPVRLDASSALQPTATTARTLSNDTRLRSLPLPDAAAVAVAPNDYLLEVRGQSGAFLHVSAGDIHGWILSENTKLSSDPIPPQQTPLTLLHADSPPTLAFKPAPAFTDKDHIKLSGTIEDDSKIKDYQAFVYSDVDHRSETRKVAFRRVDVPRTDLSLDVPLRPGLNRVRVLVRDDDGMETQESMFIYRR